MQIDYAKNFLKILENLKNDALLKKIEEVVLNVMKANNMNEIANIKKLTGYQNYYRIKVSDYRIGFEYKNNTVRFLTFLHRKDIYKKFP